MSTVRWHDERKSETKREITEVAWQRRYRMTRLTCLCGSVLLLPVAKCKEWKPGKW